jgi:hypothetical protein
MINNPDEGMFNLPMGGGEMNDAAVETESENRSELPEEAIDNSERDNQEV